MPLTISITLDDEAIAEFLDHYNDDSGTEITADMLLQNEDFKSVLEEDMINAWLEQLDDEERASAYDLYGEFFDENAEPATRTTGYERSLEPSIFVK